MSKPLTTLFLIESLDGKISTGDTDKLDVDKDFTDIVGVKEGLHQYYDLEKQTDLVSFNTGRVQAKVGANQKIWDKEEHDDESVKKSEATINIPQEDGEDPLDVPAFMRRQDKD